MPPKISAGSCGPSSIGINSDGSVKVTFASGGQSGSFFPWENTPLPPSSISGPLGKLEFHPLSNTIVSNAESAGMLSLLDASGNPLSPELHTIVANIEGGVWLYEGEEKSEITLDTIESDILFRYRPTGK